MRPAQFARQCLAFFICEIKRAHILQIGTGKALAEFGGQDAGKIFERLLSVVRPLGA